MTTITVTHYGPNQVPDPDHSTFISVRTNYGEHQSVSLQTDDEVKELIAKLQQALEKGDLNG